MTVKSDNEGANQELKSFFNRWSAIFISVLLIIITGSTTAGIIALSAKDDIKEIKEDYLPYFAFEYIVESNNKLMNILTAIDSKNDEKYQKAIKDWSDLQQEVIKQAGKNKTRSGGSSSTMGGQ